MEANKKMFIIGKDQYREIQNKINMALVAIANGMPVNKEEVFENGTWKTVQSIVRLGLAKQFFKVGDQLQCTHEVYGTGEQKLLTWDIIGIDYDIPVDENGNEIIVKDSAGNDINAHSLTLQTHDCISTAGFKINSVTGVNWENSEMRQWLNTNENMPQYDERRGFLYGFDDDLLRVTSFVAKSTARRNESGGKSKYTIDRFFLPAHTELYSTNINQPHGTYKTCEGAIFKSTDSTVDTSKIYCTKDIDDILSCVSPTGEENPCQLGWYEVKSYYDYYSQFSSNSNPSLNADSNRIKNRSDGSFSSYWWTRSPYAMYSSPWIFINGDGSITGYKSSTTEFLDISPCVVIA